MAKITVSSQSPSQTATSIKIAKAGSKHPRNTLNDLTGREWIRFTKSWFICDSRRYWKNKATELHLARFPEEMVAEFICFFSKAGEWILDPFCGSGATLVSCLETGRNGVGIELCAEYVEITRQRMEAMPAATRCYVLHADAREAAQPALWAPLIEAGLPSMRTKDTQLPPGQKNSFSGAGDDNIILPQFDFIITSPPYYNMLRKSRGGVESVAKKRAKMGLATHYGDDERNLGNIEDYEEYIEAVGQIFDGIKALLRPERYLVVVAQNIRDSDGCVRPLAWDLAARLSQTYNFQGERIWCQNSKPLGIWGYPKAFVPNYHHHYCLIFRRDE